MEASLDGIVLHRDMHLLYVNRAARKMFGYSRPEDMIGRNLSELLEFPYQQAAPRRLAALLQGAPRPRIFEMKGISRDGSNFDLELISFPTTYGGQPVARPTSVTSPTKNSWRSISSAPKSWPPWGSWPPGWPTK